MFRSKAASYSIPLTFLVFAIVYSSPVIGETEPTTNAKDGGTLSLQAGLSHGYLPMDDNKNIYSRIQVKADDVTTQDRAPLNLAVVIDRSGSMGGGRLKQAKRAAHKLVDRLSSQDRLAIVSYGSDVTVQSQSLPVKPENQDQFHSAISAIHRNGSTFLSGGFEKAASLVSAQATDDSIDRVILLSDGRANRGTRTANALGRLTESKLENGISTTTMGIGLNYDENIMATMAEMGAGNHYFIEDEKKIAKMFGQEFESLASVVARDAYLVLELGKNVELLNVRGASHRRSKGNVVVDLGAFYANQHRDVLLDLAASSAGDGARPIVDVNLHFDDVTGDEDRSVTHKVSLTGIGTDDADKLAEVRPSVMQRVEHFAYAESVKKATDAWDNGNRKKAEKILEQQKERLDEAAEKSWLAESKVQEKKRELDQKKSRIHRFGSSRSTSGKRMKKKDAEDTLDLMHSGAAF